MNISEAKQQIKDTVTAYLAKDDFEEYQIEIARQRPIFMIGAPGIGKTAIMEQIAQEMGIGMISYSMTHHTRQSALGLPFIVHKSYKGVEYDASEYTMSEIISSIYDYMERTGIERGILFLDEINCVSETLYPSMLQFLQFKTFGRHRVPDGWIIATAGNPPEYNRSVHEFDIVTLDRLRKIEVEPDYDAWKSYAHTVGIHPAITTFLEIRKECFYSVETRVGSKSFVTARGWTDLSDLIALFESTGKKVDYNLIVQYLQDEDIASHFATYYDLFNKYKSDYEVDSILAGKASEGITTRAHVAAFDERLSILGLLLDSVGNAMRDTLEREDDLRELRGYLADARDMLLDEETGESRNAPQVLEDLRAKAAERLKRGIEANAITDAKRRALHGTVNQLRDMAAFVSLERPETSREAYYLVKSRFSDAVTGVQQDVTRVESELKNMFAFVEEAFGDEQEMLIVVTELTSRSYCTRFIAHYGSASYFAHNQEMMLQRSEQELNKRIDDLVLEDNVSRKRKADDGE